MSADDDRPAGEAPAPAPMHPAVRWLARLAVVAIALRFVVQGFDGEWVDGAAVAFLYLAVLLGLCAGGLALVELARRGRGA